MFDAMLKLACEEALDREYAEAKAYADANPVIPSEDFHKRMEKLIRSGTGKAEKPQGGRVMRVCKRAAVIIMILCTISFVMLMCSAAVRAEVYRMQTEMRASIRALFERFESEHPDEAPTNDDLNELSTDMQIEAIEKDLVKTLSDHSISPDAYFQIHIDGYLNVTITGLNETDTAKLKPFFTPLASLLSGAYATPEQNRLYYVQGIIFSDYEVKIGSKDMWVDDMWEETIRFNAQVIQEYMRESGFTREDEIMRQSRNIEYVNGKLVFEELLNTWR